MLSKIPCSKAPGAVSATKEREASMQETALTQNSPEENGISKETFSFLPDLWNKVYLYPEE